MIYVIHRNKITLIVTVTVINTRFIVVVIFILVHI